MVDGWAQGIDDDPADRATGAAPRRAASAGSGGSGCEAGAADWDQAMTEALAMAAGSLRTGDVPVGCLVLSADGEVIARGRNRREADQDPTAHAEMIAIRQAAEALGSWRLLDCTLVATLEPCAMCAGAIVLARVPRLVFGAYDPKAGAAGSVLDVTGDRRLNHRPDVVGGILAEECGTVLRSFFRDRR